MINTAVKGSQTHYIVVPSLSFNAADQLKSIKGIAHYEERLLHVIFMLKNIDYYIIYLTSFPLDPYILKYYFSFLKLEGAKQRFHNLSLNNEDQRPLTDKILEHDRLIRRIDQMTSDGNKILMVLRGMESEAKLAERLGAPMYSATPEQQIWGSKQGSRFLFQQCGIPHPDGSYTVLESAEALVFDIINTCQRNPSVMKGVVKLQEGFAGRGNAIIKLEPIHSAINAKVADIKSVVLEQLESMKFVCPNHNWSTYQASILELGCIFELFVEAEDCVAVTSPSVQVLIDENYKVTVLSSHEQDLDGQSYNGCVFPANPEYSGQLVEYGDRVGLALASRGVRDHFSVDFVCLKNGSGIWSISAIEINLRLTGTTHPFMTMQLLTDGDFDRSKGIFTVNGQERHYIACDHVEDPSFTKLLPVDILEFSQTYPLLKWDKVQKVGVVFHLLGAMSQFNTIGITAIGRTNEEARRFFDDAKSLLVQLAHT